MFQLLVAKHPEARLQLEEARERIEAEWDLCRFTVEQLNGYLLKHAPSRWTLLVGLRALVRQLEECEGEGRR